MLHAIADRHARCRRRGSNPEVPAGAGRADRADAGQGPRPPADGGRGGRRPVRRWRRPPAGAGPPPGPRRGRGGRSAGSTNWRRCGRRSRRPRPGPGGWCAWPASRASARRRWSRTSWPTWRPTGRPCHVARGRCSERLAGAEAYLPVLEALDGLLRGPAGGRPPGYLRHVAPTWYAELVPAAVAGPAARTRPARPRPGMKRELVAFLRELSRRAPGGPVPRRHPLGRRLDRRPARVPRPALPGLRLLVVVDLPPRRTAPRPSTRSSRSSATCRAAGVCRELPAGLLGRGGRRPLPGAGLPGPRLPARFRRQLSTPGPRATRCSWSICCATCATAG